MVEPRIAAPVRVIVPTAMSQDVPVEKTIAVRIPAMSRRQVRELRWQARRVFKRLATMPRSRIHTLSPDMRAEWERMHASHATVLREQATEAEEITLDELGV